MVAPSAYLLEPETLEELWTLSFTDYIILSIPPKTSQIYTVGSDAKRGCLGVIGEILGKEEGGRARDGCVVR